MNSNHYKTILIALTFSSCAPLPVYPERGGGSKILSAEERVLIGTWATSDSIDRRRFNSIYHLDADGTGLRRDRYDGKIMNKPISWRIAGSVLHIDQGAGSIWGDSGSSVTFNGNTTYHHTVPSGFFSYSLRFPGDENFMMLKDVRNPSRNLALQRISKTARMNAIEAFARFDTQ